MIDDLKQRLARYNLPAMPESYEGRAQAAVLVPINTVGEPSLVLTERASRMGSHAGEVAWPGGKQDPEDDDLVVTALRETHEEIGVAPLHVEVIGGLRPFVSKFGLLVTPYVGLISEPVTYQPNPDELAAIFEVPIEYLLDDPRTQTDVIARHGETHHVPVYEYDGFRIWGLTAMILRDFLVNGMDVPIK